MPEHSSSSAPGGAVRRGAYERSGCRVDRCRSRRCADAQYEIVSVCLVYSLGYAWGRGHRARLAARPVRICGHPPARPRGRERPRAPPRGRHICDLAPGPGRPAAARGMPVALPSRLHVKMYAHTMVPRGPDASVHRTERPRRRTHTVRPRAQSRFCCRSTESLIEAGSS